ncbi:hypothetical protein AABB02_33665 [Streptomyces rimosus]|uniref:hypothetical protein n=1 Tax=Streptomyces rimosus TaxID=1927 RepID=UPI0031D1BAFC
MTPDDFAQLRAASRDLVPFATGSEGHDWMANWCDRCVHDRPAREGRPAQGCPLVLVALTGRTPLAWHDGHRDAHGRYTIADQYRCTEFRAEDGRPDVLPRPVPVAPGQLELPPATPWKGDDQP